MHGDILPLHDVFVVGKPIEIYCFSFTSPVWRFYPISSSNKIKKSGHKVGSLYTMGKQRNRLLIRKSHYNDQGAYECRGSYHNESTFTVRSYIYVGSK